MNLTTPNELTRIAQEIKKAGGSVSLAGGPVRDAVRGCQPQDWDCEVFGLTYSQLTDALSPFGPINTVGRSFGVVKLTTESNDYDFTLARQDNKAGRGHLGFVPEFLPDITPKEAAYRRDFTFNSMSIDILTGELTDHFGGVDDLRKGVITHTSNAFLEDGAVRVLRGFKFVARLGVKASQDLVNVCDTPECKGQLAYEHGNRVLGEWLDWAIKGKYLGQGLDYLKDIGWLDLFPGLAELDETEQDAEYHPEGNAFEHTKLAIDAASRIAKRDGLNELDTFILIMSALVHDMGKIDTTTRSDDGRITSHGHAEEQERARSFLLSIGLESDGAYTPEGTLDKILVLAKYHMVHINKNTAKSTRRLALRLSEHGATITELVRVIEADHSGRAPLPGGMPGGAIELVRLAKENKVADDRPKPILMGRHLIEMGMPPGVRFGEILRQAFEAQINDEFSDINGAIEWLKARV